MNRAHCSEHKEPSIWFLQETKLIQSPRSKYKAPGATRHGLSTAQLKLPVHTYRPISHALQKNLSHPSHLQFCLSICLGFLNFICTVIFSFHRYFGGEGWYCCPLEWCQGTNTGGKLSVLSHPVTHTPPPIMWEIPHHPPPHPPRPPLLCKNWQLAATWPNSLSYIDKMYCNLSVNTAVFNWNWVMRTHTLGADQFVDSLKGMKHRMKAMRAVWIYSMKIWPSQFRFVFLQLT